MRKLALVMAVALLLTGCATAPARQPASVDLTGHWSGSWEGYGIFAISRHDVARAEFVQRGDRGRGRLWLDGALAAESVPLAARLAGLTGVPVELVVSGNQARLYHEGEDRVLGAEFTVTGDRMVGRVLNTELPARIVLERVPPPKAEVTPAPPVAAAPPPPAPPPAPPVAAAPAPPPPPPAPPVASRPEPREFSPTDALKPVHFDFDRATIRESETAVLDANVRWLQDNRDVLVIVEGHCDERGTNAYNLALGERRARAVRDYLVSRGVAADRITVLSYGEERPACTQATEDCWKQNRRAAFLTKPK